MGWNWDMREKGDELSARIWTRAKGRMELPLFIELGQIADRADLQREVMSLVLECICLDKKMEMVYLDGVSSIHQRCLRAVTLGVVCA